MIVVAFTSLLLQIFAVGYAVRLARNSKLGFGSSLIVLALILMLVRRLFVFFALEKNFGTEAEQLYREWNSFFIVVLIASGLVLIGKSISKTKRDELEEGLNRERLNAIISSSEDAIVTKDLKGTIRSWNASAQRIFGYTPDEAIGQSITMLIAPERRFEEEEILNKISKGIRVEHLETERVRKDGEKIYISVTSSPIKGPDGKILGATKIARDITVRKRQEARILESEAKFKALAEQKSKLLDLESGVRKQVETANRLKDQFLATLSHELRTPLNAILGWAQLLGRDSSDPKRVVEGLKIIERNARNQSQIIEDLLDVNRIMSGNVHLELQNLDLGKIVDEAIDSILPSAAAKEISIIKFKDLDPTLISADITRVRQIIGNLLTNAVKFTNKSGVVNVSLKSKDKNVQLIVEDNGEGIDEKFLPFVFDRFSQADPSKTRKHGGLGLGLSIVKDLCELHRGNISVKSEGPGKGSSFIVTLPKSGVLPTEIGESVPQETNGHRNESLKGFAILVVDDEEDARGLVREFLEEKRAKVVVASSCADALIKLNNNLVDLIISDISMPNEDGYQLIRKVRSLKDQTKSLIPAIALTAFAKNEDRNFAFESGFQSYVTKPIELPVLLAEINNLKNQANSKN